MEEPVTRVEDLRECGAVGVASEAGVAPLCRWEYEDRYGDHIEFVPEHEFMLRIALRRAVIATRLRAAEACLASQAGSETAYLILRGPLPWAGTTAAPVAPLSAAEKAALAARALGDEREPTIK